MTALFGKKKKDDLSDIPDLPPLDLSQVPSGPPLTGAPQRLQDAENADLYPASPQNRPPLSFPGSQLPPPPSPPVQQSSIPQPSPIPYSEAPFPQAPIAPSASSSDNVTLMTEDIEKIAEDIIDEKWTKIVGELNEIKNWKDTVAEKVDELKESLSKLESRVSDVQKAMMGKVGEYNKNIKDVNVELKAMSKVFEKIMPAFTSNVKRLSQVSKPRAISRVEVAAKSRGRPKKKKK